MTALKDIRTQTERGVQIPISHATRDASHSEARQKLVQAVQIAVSEFNPADLRPPHKARPGVACQPPALLGLLTFWYARQVYSSLEILVRLRLDMAGYRLSDDCLPDVAMLRDFRSQNRVVLESCLAKTLQLTMGEKIPGLLTHVAEGHFAREAKRRVTMGLFTDCLEAEAANSQLESAENGFIVAKE